MKDKKQEIEDLFDIVVKFDDLCDEMRDKLIYILDYCSIEEMEYTQMGLMNFTTFVL